MSKSPETFGEFLAACAEAFAKPLGCLGLIFVIGIVAVIAEKCGQ